jgi:hypothetical protein
MLVPNPVSHNLASARSLAMVHLFNQKIITTGMLNLVSSSKYFILAVGVRSSSEGTVMLTSSLAMPERVL